MTLPERLKAWRLKLGLTQRAFAKHTKIALRSIQSYESGTRTPGIDALTALAKSGADLNWLIVGSKDNNEDSKELAKLWAEIMPIVNQLLSLNESKRVKLIEEISNRVSDAEKAYRLDSINHEIDNESESVEFFDFNNAMKAGMAGLKTRKQVEEEEAERDRLFIERMALVRQNLPKRTEEDF